MSSLKKGLSKLKRKAMNGLDEMKRAVSGQGVEVPRDAGVPSQPRVEVMTTDAHSTASVDRPDALEAWEMDPDLPVIMPPLPPAPQGLQSNGRSRAGSGRSKSSGNEEKNRNKTKFGHSKSRSRTSSAIGSSSHQSRLEVDLLSSDAQQQRQMRSSGQRTSPAVPATRDEGDLIIIDNESKSQQMEKLTSYTGAAFPNVNELEITATRPLNIDLSQSLPTRLTNESSSTASTYVRSLGT